ncbi:hypothetical protein DNTS_002705 [Danionella cerebrum]|uniref:Pentraxin (PTX) domain-containing protein n=1 Tax=Danionella cerebrum TaxID=2873325 RepID=A0A553MKT7_9TELE|nr:hypothetical protein DNTS_002705 [Danionella translucida]
MLGFCGSKKLFVIFIVCFCTCNGKAMSNSDYGAHTRFICSPIPPEADPGCFPNTGHHGGPSGNSNGFWGMSEEAKTTILHLRESLVQQKEMLLDQRETIRELTAKLSLCQCEGFNGGTGNNEDRPHLAHHAHHAYPSAADHGKVSWTGHHRGKATPELSRNHAGGHHRGDGNHGRHHGTDHYHSGLELSQHGDGTGSHHGNIKAVGDRDKHITGEIHPVSASPETMGRMLHNLKERLHNLQSRNTSSIYSSSLKDLLQRKISALEQQMQHHSSPLTAHTEHEGEDEDEEDEHHDDHHEDDDNSDGDHHEDDDHDDSHHHDDHEDHEDDEEHGEEEEEGTHNDHHSEHEDHHEEEEEDEDHENREKEHEHRENEVSPHGFERLTYELKGHRETPGGAHSKLEAVLSQLQHRLSEGPRKKSKAGESFQIGFPMRSNFMYGRVKRTLLQEIFAFTLCLWLKAGMGQGIGTPFSYSSPGQSNEIVLIEWGNNPMELLVEDRDGVKRGSGENLSPWHPIKPGGVFILGQEQDTLGGRFDATQAFVGEISDVQMWSHVLTPKDVYGIATCGGHMTGDIIAWSEGELELHGGVTKYPFHPCD